MRAPQPSLIPRTVRGKDGHLPLDRRVVQPAPPALFARLPIANQLRKETPDGGLTHEVVMAPQNRVNSRSSRSSRIKAVTLPQRFASSLMVAACSGVNRKDCVK